MADTSIRLPRISTEQRRAAAGQFERAKQVIKAGDLDYGMQLLLNCCKIDPSSLVYRQELRLAQRSKYGNNERGQPLAYVRSLMPRFRLQKAILKQRYLEALVEAEVILMRNPWDLAAHLSMAQVFEELQWPDHALWTLEQIRPTQKNNPKVNRPLARLYEKRGNFNQAIALWELVRKFSPDDKEAQRKAKDLAASATIAKGRYEEVVRGDAPSPMSQSDADMEAAPEEDQAAEETPTPRRGEKRAPREVTAVLDRIKNDPKNANAYLQLATVYRKAERYDEAKAILQQGLGPTGNNFDIKQELIDLDIEPFRRDLAVTEEELRKNPKDIGLKDIRAKLGKEINARELEFYRNRSDRNPADAGARYEMGLRLLRVGQTDEAIKELQAVRNEPRFHGHALYYLGFCFKARNNWRLAQRNLEEAIQHLTEKDVGMRKEAMYVLAVGYADAGELNRAIDLGSDLANLDYSFKDISQRVDEWQSKAAK